MGRSLWVVLLPLAVLGACSSPGPGFTESGGADSGDLGADGAVGPGLDATLGGGDGSGDGAAGEGSLFNDATPDASGDACIRGDAGPAPFPQRCAAATTNECDGPTDTALSGLGVPAALLNGSRGNGFDDDCDGLVDEGCTCPGFGQTKDCYAVPATQVDPKTGKPVGWCTDNSKGSLDCARAEFPTWSGTCRGAQPPYRHDVCAPGDFNCDGLEENSDIADCSCKVDPVTCPTAPVIAAPYPDPKNLPLVDGSQWITNAADRPNATSWTWTLVGGDCDNVLPHPTFALYTSKDSTLNGARKGVRQTVKYDPNASPARFLAAAGEPLIAIQAVNFGNGVAGAQVFPAFGLSGDYVVQGEWDLNGTHYVCTQKVQVRAPGIRAELCWDTVGGNLGGVSGGNDLDLHVARLQGVTCTGSTQGWDTVCSSGTTYQDCWYHPVSGCRDSSITAPLWGYADSANSACLGWSSKRDPAGRQKCTNPRLDKDTIQCDPSQDDPTFLGSAVEGFTDPFCGPENINLDNPADGDAFVVGVNHYDPHGGTTNAKPHVNLYCNGARVLSAGYNPLTGQTSYPLLNKPGGEVSGDWWTVATIKAHVTAGVLTSCDVASVPSHHADPTRDGPSPSAPPNDTTGLCVESTANATPGVYQYNYVDHRFIDHATLQNGPAGSRPVNIGDWCKH
jgi:hypothetical protein